MKHLWLFFLLVMFLASLWQAWVLYNENQPTTNNLQLIQPLTTNYLASPAGGQLPTTILPVETYYGTFQDTTIQQVITHHNLTIYSEDKIRFFPDPKYRLGTTLTVFRATPITIIDSRKAQLYRTWQKDVVGLLDEQKIELGENDRLEPAATTSLSADLTIIITRVSITEIKIKKSLDFTIVYQDDPEIDKGLEKIKQEGQKGEKMLIYRVTRENGEEKKRELIKEEITKEPVGKIILRGTKEVIYGQGLATWYGGVGALTAAHNTLPMGTKVLVTNLTNGRSVIVTIKDHGIQGGAIIDLSADAFKQIASLGTGVVSVRLTKP